MTGRRVPLDRPLLARELPARNEPPTSDEMHEIARVTLGAEYSPNSHEAADDQLRGVAPRRAPPPRADGGDPRAPRPIRRDRPRHPTEAAFLRCIGTPERLIWPRRLNARRGGQSPSAGNSVNGSPSSAVTVRKCRWSNVARLRVDHWSARTTIEASASPICRSR